MSSHYALHVLERYRSGGLPWPRRLFCRLHLLGCRLCRKRLQSLEANDRFLQDLLSAVKKYSHCWSEPRTDEAAQGRFSENHPR